MFDPLDPRDSLAAYEEESTSPSEDSALHPTPLRAFSASDRVTLLPAIGSAVSLCGGWVLERKSRSAAELEILFEVQLGSIEDLYAELVGAGIEFSRPAHARLTDLCTCRRHLAPAPRCGQILTFKLDITFFTTLSLEQSLERRAVRA